MNEPLYDFSIKSANSFSDGINKSELPAFLLVQPFAPCRQLLRPLLTSRSGSSPSPFQVQTRSPQVRTRSLSAQPPNLRHQPLDHKSFALMCMLALIGTASCLFFCSSARGFVPYFLPTLGHPHAVVLPFARCGQLAGGRPPPRSRPCWAHTSSPNEFGGILRKNETGQYAWLSDSHQAPPEGVSDCRHRPSLAPPDSHLIVASYSDKNWL